jgi:hypothetical protein
MGLGSNGWQIAKTAFGRGFPPRLHGVPFMILLNYLKNMETRRDVAKGTMIFSVIVMNFAYIKLSCLSCL